MTITPHILVGSALASAATTNLPIAFLIGFFSHFILDALPHVDPGTFFCSKDPTKKETESWPLWIYIYAILEFVIASLVLFFLFKNKANFEIIVVGGIGGITVDILDNNPLRFMRQWPILRQIHWLHQKLHYDLPQDKWYWGLPLQIIIMGVCLWYLLKY